MRERLIQLISNADEECKHSKDCKSCSGYGKGSQCMNYHIADHLLANGVIVPPCKVGDKIYKVWYAECHNGSTFTDSFECDGCVDECDIKKVITEVNAPSSEFIISNFMGGFKNDVYYLTREEAEAKLKGETK